MPCAHVARRSPRTTAASDDDRAAEKRMKAANATRILPGSDLAHRIRARTVCGRLAQKWTDSGHLLTLEACGFRFVDAQCARLIRSSSLARSERTQQTLARPLGELFIVKLPRLSHAKFREGCTWRKARPPCPRRNNCLMSRCSPESGGFSVRAGHRTVGAQDVTCGFVDDPDELDVVQFLLL
eukprot:226473-Rhodomonas_salina.1